MPPKRSPEELNTRQVPCRKEVTSEKNYCDILYAWIQCHSERVSAHSRDRQINKRDVVFTKIEKEMVDSQGEKIMSRKTISKYFHWLEEQGFLVEDGDFYKIRVLAADEGNVIYYKTLSILMNVFQRHCIDIYQYLYSRFCAVGREPFVVPIAQIKEYIGIATNTTSNNAKVMDTLTIFKKIGLLDYERVWDADNLKEHLQINWVVDRLS